jgi:hypothetical protein
MFGACTKKEWAPKLKGACAATTAKRVDNQSLEI